MMDEKVIKMEQVPFGKFGYIHPSTIEWMKKNLYPIIAIGVGFLALGGWTFYQWSTGSPGDYLIAEKTFNEWTGDRSAQLLKLQKILKQHPELHAKYDGRIAQKLLINSQEGLAASFAKATQSRIGDFSPYYLQFSNCSLLIGKKKLKEALSQSKALKASLESDADFWKSKSEIVQHGTILYGYNLIRIAFLEQLAGTKEGELSAWKEFKREAGWIATEPPLRQLNREDLHQISQNFQKNDLSLKDFILYREMQL